MIVVAMRDILTYTLKKTLMIMGERSKHSCLGDVIKIEGKTNFEIYAGMSNSYHR